MNRNVLMAGVAAIAVALVGSYHWLVPGPSAPVPVPVTAGSQAGAPSGSSGRVPVAEGTVPGSTASNGQQTSAASTGSPAAVSDPAATGAAGTTGGATAGSTASPSGASSAAGADKAVTGDVAQAGPQFDIVRTGPDGSSVIAGRATPGAEVRIQDGDVTLGTVKAGPKGDWVFLPDQPLAVGPHEISLTEVIKDENGQETTRQSSKIVVVIVPDPAAATAGSTAETTDGQSGSAGNGSATGSVAVAVPREGSGSATLLQGQASGDSGKFQRNGTASGAAAPVVVETLDYDDKGNVELSGRASPGSAVQLYLDNKPVGRTDTDHTGQWRISPDENVDPGRYTLRADQLGQSGKVTARVELPVQVASDPLAGSDGKRIVVQPGNSLWRIARATMGDGFHYTDIYQANRDQIRDPDLIYPGQIFTLPEASDGPSATN